MFYGKVLCYSSVLNCNPSGRNMAAAEEGFAAVSFCIRIFLTKYKIAFEMIKMYI